LLLLAFILPFLNPGAGLAAPASVLPGLTNLAELSQDPFRLPKSRLSAQGADTCETATIHYTRRNADYDGWGLHIWGPTAVTGVTWTSPFEPTSEDDYGLIWEVPMAEGADLLNYIVHRGDEKDPGPDQVMTFSEVGCEIWLTQGKADQFLDSQSALDSWMVVISTPAPAGENQAIIHYTRITGDYDGWGLHIWGSTVMEGITWTSPLNPAGQDDYGIYWIIDMQPTADSLNYIVHKGDQKDPGPDQILNFNAKGREIWLIEGSAQQFSSPEEALEAQKAAKAGDITNKALAYWVSKNTLAWDVNLDPNDDVYIYYDPEGHLQLTENGIEGGQTIPLTFSGKTLPIEILLKFPHLKGLQTFRVADEYLDLLPEVLRGQIAIGAIGLDGLPQGAAALQIPGVLDDLYAEAAWDATLGVEFEGEIPTLRVWAPTAKSVSLLLYEDSTTSEAETIPMEFDTFTGIWSVTGETDWNSRYYLYDAEVFIRQQGEFVHNLVTDPYSLSLNTNSIRSQIVDLNDPNLIPAGWGETAKPELAAFTDVVLYELHLRDFSAIDETVPDEQRGTYLAFTNPESAGMQHLARLAEAGVTHIHLLPVFDIATINENKAEWQNPDFDELSSYPPDSEEQQALINPLRGLDGFNWGYDPFHYTAPEGSYSADPEGTARILEFRQMVQALNASGLRVVMDVVYNHTNAAGQGDKSVLDKIVPGYYHRLDFKGDVTNSTCCANTATEHDMMRKLMIDSALTWATAYKVDGFRFDLMGHHMKADMIALREALDALTPEIDGVDGSMIYVYGEGWDFGEVAGNARGVNATQVNMSGTGIGTFNDRGRDAVRGGTPFTPKQDQGFATGMYTDPNEANTLTESEQLAKLLLQKDQLRVTLAGNLADFQFIGADGEIINGVEVDYEGQPAGYTASPQENIIYVSAHDNETLFDTLQYKMPASATLEERIQVQSLALSLVAFSQGVPFFHAGSELLRSKSMDRDSYDSSDWFNALDWTYNDNGWGHGLPLEDKNGENWPLIQPLLANPDSAPSRAEILQMQGLFKQWIKIRQSSPLFRLQTAEQIQNQVRFHNTGPDQVPGLIVMSISDDDVNPINTNYGVIFVLWNAALQDVQFTLEGYEVGDLSLHPLLTDPYNSQASYDGGTQSFNLPGRSVAVFVGDTPLAEPEPEAAPQIEGAEPTSKPEPTEIPATEAAELSPTANAPLPEGLPQSQAGQSNLWIYLLGGAAVIAVGIGAFWWRKREK